MVTRRGFLGSLAGALLTAPLAAKAQQGSKPPRVGFLIPSSSESAAPLLAALHQRLRARGFVEGQTFVFEYRYAEGRMERLPDLAADLVGRHVNVILSVSTPATLAAKARTSSIPIVMVEVAVPIGSGLVASLGRPGSNVTGLSALTRDLSGKRLELLKDHGAQSFSSCCVN